MPGPWENYQAAPSTAGPWEKYTAPPKAKYATGGGPGKFHNPTEAEKKQAKSDIESRPRISAYGLGPLVEGIEEVTGSTRPQNTKRGIHDLITGAGEIALPLAGEAIVAAPLRAAGAAAGGYIGSKIGHGAAKFAGASDDTANLAGDAAGGLGALEGSTGFKATKYLTGGLKSLTPEWIRNFHEAGKATAQGGSIPAKSTLSPKAKAGMPEPKTAAPKNTTDGTETTVDAPAADEASKSAAELMKSVGITPEEALKATTEQWKMIEQQVGSSFDRQRAIEHLKRLSKESPKPSPKVAADIGTGPKTPKPSPGGAKVESTMTPEARAARADEHATKLAATIRKTLPADKIPEASNDAAWKVLESQTGTEATPEVRKAAIDKARKLWSEGPRSAGDLQKRRSDYFAKFKAPASSSE